MIYFQTEKEDQTALTGQARDAQQNADQGYYDDGPSMMPSSESYAGHQENWGASATEEWGTGAPTAGGESSWNPSSAVNTGTTAW